MYEILKAGGFTTGGMNFDAKIRRQSIDPDDLLHAHVGSMDACARGLLIAAKMIEDGKLGEDRRRALRQMGRAAEPGDARRQGEPRRRSPPACSSRASSRSRNPAGRNISKACSTTTSEHARGEPETHGNQHQGTGDLPRPVRGRCGAVQFLGRDHQMGRLARLQGRADPDLGRPHVRSRRRPPSPRPIATR